MFLSLLINKIMIRNKNERMFQRIISKEVLLARKVCIHMKTVSALPIMRMVNYNLINNTNYL